MNRETTLIEEKERPCDDGIHYDGREAHSHHILDVCCACVTELSPLILLDSVLFARFANVLGLREGLVHAKLDWSNEAQAVKQSWAVMLTMLVCWGVLLAAGAAWLMWLAELVSPEAFLLGFGAVLLFLDTLLLRWLQTAGAERFSRLG